jgi:hypothetical protein
MAKINGGEERRGYGLRELALQYGLSVSFLRLEIERGRLRPLRFGRRLIISNQAWAEYMAIAGAAGAASKKPAKRRQR